MGIKSNMPHCKFHLEGSTQMYCWIYVEYEHINRIVEGLYIWYRYIFDIDIYLK